MLRTLLTVFYASFLYYVVQHNDIVPGFHESWQFQYAVMTFVAIIIFIWLNCYVVFDELKQMLTIRRGLTRILPPNKVYYSEIDKIIVKRHAHEDEDGVVTNEGYFHLQLKNKKTCLLMVFQDKNAIDFVLKKLKSHTEIKLQTY